MVLEGPDGCHEDHHAGIETAVRGYDVEIFLCPQV
jgi:hypothetical protein